MDNQVFCRSCEKPETDEFYIELRRDFYGLPTGNYCDDCYENKYPYRKDGYYDYFEAGEYMDDDY